LLRRPDDVRPYQSLYSQETVTVGDVGPGSAVGILVDPASGYGEYTLSVEELGT